MMRPSLSYLVSHEAFAMSLHRFRPIWGARLVSKLHPDAMDPRVVAL
jgi:hypothetical protein